MPIHCNTNTHTISLRFKIDNNASQKYINNWIQFKNVCESGNNKEIVTKWLFNCRIDSVKNIPYLLRSEGGIGGCNNLIHKQIRFRQHLVYLKDNDICKCLKLRFRLMLQRDLCFKEDDELPK